MVIFALAIQLLLCRFALATPPPTLPQSHGKSALLFKPEKSIVSSSELDTNTASVRKFKDPYDFHIAGSTQTVEFYAYGASLLGLEAISCFKGALNDAIITHRNAATAINDTLLSYTSYTDKIGLTLVPRDTMTWRMWADALGSMIAFILDGMHREWQFLVLEEGIEGEIGYGALVNKIHSTS
ncbi:hypothetical protein ACLMJK_000819 [Lecanora helva]